MTLANEVWLSALNRAAHHYDYISSPRNQKVKELLNYTYELPMNEPVVTHAGRNLNYPFMFAEAAWILSGRNDLEFILPYMKNYQQFSDDGFSLNGAYGPKLIDQLSWAAEELYQDPDSRRCYINIWRERPGPSKDIPCTTGLQFILRNGELNLIVNMRSQDAVWGMPYDMFTFSAIGKYMQVYLWMVKNFGVGLGKLYVRAGSFHIYERHFDDTETWLETTEENDANKAYLKACSCLNPQDFISNLVRAAQHSKGRQVSK